LTPFDVGGFPWRPQNMMAMSWFFCFLFPELVALTESLLVGLFAIFGESGDVLCEALIFPRLFAFPRSSLLSEFFSGTVFDCLHSMRLAERCFQTDGFLVIFVFRGRRFFSRFPFGLDIPL